MSYFDTRSAGLRHHVGPHHVGPHHVGPAGIDQLVNDRITSLHRTAETIRTARSARIAARRPSPSELTAVGTHVATVGIERAERQVAKLVKHARRAGVSPTLIEILADRQAPAVVRERALGKVLVAVSVSADERRQTAPTEHVA